MNRFPKQLRLCDKSQIKNVFDQKQKLSQSNIAVFYCRNEIGCARLGIVISKKNIALAVKRNTIKRIVRESFRSNQEKIKNFDIVVFPYKGAEKITNEELRLCLEKQWLKLAKYQES